MRTWTGVNAPSALAYAPRCPGVHGARSGGQFPGAATNAVVGGAVSPDRHDDT